jgi:peptide/nickel transport system ATP-binding protein
LEIARGEFFTMLGPSGSGKTTTLRMIAGFEEPSGGTIELGGRDVSGVAPYDREVNTVFQDYALFPHMDVGSNVAYGLQIRKVPSNERRDRVAEALRMVRLEGYQSRRPSQLSGGQRQRVNIARALAFEPKLLLLDEAVSALDKSVEAQVLNLLLDLKDDFKLTYIFISHDLDVVRFISDRVLVMYLGRVSELGPSASVLEQPTHPYTQALLASVPSMDPAARVTEAPLAGDPPNPINPPTGCRFHPRCRLAEDICSRTEPPLDTIAGGHLAACHAAIPGSGHSHAPTQATAGAKRAAEVSP